MACEITCNNFEISLMVFFAKIISLQIMLLPIQIIFSILVILWPINWPYTAIKFFLIAFSNYNVVFFHWTMSYFVWSQLKLKKLFFRVHTDLKSSWILTNPWKVLDFFKSLSLKIITFWKRKLRKYQNFLFDCGWNSKCLE